MEQAVGVIQQRVNSLGVTEPEIQIQGQNQVIVNIPGITDADRAVKVIGRTAQLGFYEVLATDGQLSVPQDEVDEAREEIGQNLREDDAFEEGQTKILFEDSPSPSGNGNFVAGYVVNEHPDMTGDAVRSANLRPRPGGPARGHDGAHARGGSEFADLSAQIAENALGSGQPGTDSSPSSSTKT